VAVAEAVGVAEGEVPGVRLGSTVGQSLVGAAGRTAGGSVVGLAVVVGGIGVGV